MSPVNIRYIANNIDEAVEFYTEMLDFEIVMQPAPGFVLLSRGDLRLFVNAPGAGGAGTAMPDGTEPQPGGWNRFQLEVDDLESIVKELKGKGARFRNDIVVGRGGKQILLEDPSGNPIELFESTR
jgi:catechol 2,3-dioxygenase-like lactoylglutathione lyase family enzyme